MTPDPEVFDLVTKPAVLRVLTSKDCPNCPLVVAELRRLEGRCPGVSLEVLDVTDAETLRARHGVGSVPATIVDDDFAIQGQVTSRAMAELLVARGTTAYDTEKLRALLDARRIDEAAAFVGEPGKAVAVMPILQSGELSARMGVTLVLQTAHEQAPGSVADVVPPLIRLLASDNPSLRGDVADLLGSLGDRRAVEALRSLVSDEDEDVASAAQDALALLEEV